MLHVRFKVVAFSPFVPGFQDNQLMLRLVIANAIDSLVQMLLKDLRSGILEDMTIDPRAGGVIPAGHDTWIKFEGLWLGELQKRQNFLVVVNMEWLLESFLIEVYRRFWSEQFAQGIAQAPQTGAAPAGTGDGKAVKAKLRDVFGYLFIVDDADQIQRFQPGFFGQSLP